MSSIDAFILIGGLSSRMGRDKAAIEINGVPMSELVAKAIREALPQVKIRLVAADEMQLMRLLNIDILDGFLLDIYKGRGPAGGVYTALANSEKEWAFIAACDLPFLTPNVITTLSDQIRENNDVIVPLQPDGRVQPLAAFYKVKTVREHLANLLEIPRPSPSMAEVFVGLNVIQFAFDHTVNTMGSGEIFHNVNTPGDII